MQAVGVIIELACDPLSEYELIVQLRERGWQLPTDAADTLALFQSHFMIYHCLYRLQSDYWQKSRRCLEISALRIQLHPAAMDGSAAAPSAYTDDKALRAYYSDIKNLGLETAASVNRLINQFWHAYGVDSDAEHALQIFGLVQPVRYVDIKQRYRQLAMEHHPDRGGDPEVFRRINWAFEVLQCRFKTDPP